MIPFSCDRMTASELNKQRMVRRQDYAWQESRGGGGGMVAPVEDLVREHGHVDARVALTTDPQVMEAVVGEHVEPVAQERVVVLSFETTSTTTKHQYVVFNKMSVFLQQ